MKVMPARVQAFLRDPGAVRVVLLYGEDAGMIRDRAETLVRAIAGSLDDPFLIVELARDQMRDLPNEAASMALTGGRRVVRIRDVTDAAADSVRSVLKSDAPALVVLEGGSLPSRSKLRTLLETAPDGTAIGCYPEEGRALEETIRVTLQEAGVGDRSRRAVLAFAASGGGSSLHPGRTREAGAVCRPWPPCGHRCGDDLCRGSGRAVPRGCPVRGHRRRRRHR